MDERTNVLSEEIAQFRQLYVNIEMNDPFVPRWSHIDFEEQEIPH